MSFAIGSDYSQIIVPRPSHSDLLENHLSDFLFGEHHGFVMLACGFSLSWRIIACCGSTYNTHRHSPITLKRPLPNFKRHSAPHKLLIYIKRPSSFTASTYPHVQVGLDKYYCSQARALAEFIRLQRSIKLSHKYLLYSTGTDLAEPAM